jgi:hypothetical protein
MLLREGLSSYSGDPASRGRQGSESASELRARPAKPGARHESDTRLRDPTGPRTRTRRKLPMTQSNAAATGGDTPTSQASGSRHCDWPRMFSVIINGLLQS